MIEQKFVNTMRKLALDEIAEANSGHPGIALGIAPMLFAVFKNMKICPQQPNWFNRDRFVLSGGHGSSLLYATLHLFGFDVSLKDLKNFRKFSSKTPGHPEIFVTAGVDASTGALGQGFATAVGMALAETHLNAKLQKSCPKLCDHFTFVVCGDGDLMEGISYESASLAGKFGLNKLIALYDSNGVTMTDKLNITSDEDTEKRFRACGWDVLSVLDGENFEEIEKAIKQAKKSKSKPTLIICKTTIGFGSKLSGLSKCHGTPFKKEEVSEICENFGLSKNPFEIDSDVLKYAEKLKTKGQKEFLEWQEIFKNFKKTNQKLFDDIFGNAKKYMDVLGKITFEEDISGRHASGKILNVLNKKIGNFFGGGADVATSTMAYLDGEENFSKETKLGKNIPFGVREHAMSAIVNGIALHGGLRTFASTFLIFSDYMKYGIRQSALMELPVLYIFSHDSIFIGEDGPSHQPVEQISSLRLVPNLTVFRPADAKEVLAGFKIFGVNEGPIALVLSRQTLPLLKGTDTEKAFKHGGYIISKEKGKLDIVLIASGSEVFLCMKAKEQLELQGFGVRVVSMPDMNWFLMQPLSYRNSVLPKNSKKISVEAGATPLWKQIVGENGIVMGVDEFGFSGKSALVAEHFKLTEKEIVKNAKKLIKA